MISWQYAPYRNGRPIDWPDEDDDLPTMDDYLDDQEGESDV